MCRQVARPPFRGSRKRELGSDCARRHRRTPRPRGVDVVPEDPLLQVAYFLGGVDTQLVGEQLTVVPIDLEGVTCPAISVQRLHEQLDWPLPKGLSGHQLAGARDSVGHCPGLQE